MEIDTGFWYIAISLICFGIGIISIKRSLCRFGGRVNKALDKVGEDK